MPLIRVDPCGQNQRAANLDADAGEAVLLKRGGRSASGLESALPNANEDISN